jgi:hypothetical protein
MASILGIRIGYDGQDRLEHRIGPGRAITGGHPQGDRIWNLGRSGWSLHSGGFNYRPEGHYHDHVVEELSIMRGRQPGAPNARIPHGELVVWPGVTLRMSRAEIESLLARKRLSHQPYHANPAMITLQESGFVRLGSDLACTKWQIRYDFDGERLQEVTIDTDDDYTGRGTD